MPTETIDSLRGRVKQAMRTATVGTAQLGERTRYSIIRHPWVAMTLACVGISVVAMCDYVTGTHISLSILYLVPIFLIASVVGRRLAIELALLSGLLSLGADLAHMGVTSQAFPYLNAVSRSTIFVAAALVVSKLHDVAAAERLIARADTLTGAANRRAFFEIGIHEIDRSARYGHPFTVVYIDVDDFKVINDSLGHTVGDRVLRDVARTLQHNTRRTDTVARLGGDEFAVLLPETDIERGKRVLDKLRGELRLQTWDAAHDISFSIGGITFRTPPASVDEMISRADSAMYLVKHHGKDGVAHLVADGRDIFEAPPCEREERIERAFPRSEYELKV